MKLINKAKETRQYTSDVSTCCVLVYGIGVQPFSGGFFVCLFLRHLAAKYTELVRLSVPAV